MSCVALIVAAGRGARAGGSGSVPKQYASLGRCSVLALTIAQFEPLEAIHAIRVVIHPDDGQSYARAVAGCGGKLLPPVYGGATRQASVLAGLESLASAPPRRVLVHDAARPFVDADTILRVVAALDLAPGAIAALPLADTLKRSDGARATIASTLDRAGLWRAQTPQGFDFGSILDAHRRARDQCRADFTDDAAVAEWAGLEVRLVAGTERNLKITTAEDIAMAEQRLSPAMETRTGTGFDVHRFTDGDHVWLCGVRIPHSHRLEGHSDADVGLHALTDAILGAIGDGDIGQHFPPSDHRWKGAASHLFLADAARRVAARGGSIVNVDVTLLCEAPRVGPHREAMRDRIAAILAIAKDRVGVKATTTEGLGFTGRREGIAAMATASVRLPAP